MDIDKLQPKCSGPFTPAKDPGDPETQMNKNKMRPIYKSEHQPPMYLYFWTGRDGDINNWVCGPNIDGKGFASSYKNGDTDCPDTPTLEGNAEWEVQVNK